MSDAKELCGQMDWQQVVLNGGPPCFHVERERFCVRAQGWAGHNEMHKFVSLADLVYKARVAAFWEASGILENAFDECETLNLLHGAARLRARALEIDQEGEKS
jgi:hypothetical protein